VNRFVAGFIGSPAMNFTVVRLNAMRDDLRAANSGFHLDMPAAIGRRLRAYTEREVVMGIRPENLRVATGADPDGLCFDAMVELVEKLGSEILLDVQVGGQTMAAAVDPAVRAKRGDKIRLAVDPDRLHFFDATTEAAI
jgi:multiple sugar transport system ATP-binding protein